MFEFIPTSAPTIRNIAITMASTNLLVSSFMHDAKVAGVSDFMLSSILVPESQSKLAKDNNAYTANTRIHLS